MNNKSHVTLSGREAFFSRWLSGRSFEDGLVIAIRASLRCFWSATNYGPYGPRACFLGFCIISLAIRKVQSQNLGINEDMVDWIGKQLDIDFSDENYKIDLYGIYNLLFLSTITSSADNKFEPDRLIELINMSEGIIQNARKQDEDQPLGRTTNNPVSWIATYEDLTHFRVMSNHELLGMPLFGDQSAATLLADASLGALRMGEIGLALISTWYQDVIDGIMPPPEFLDEVATLSSMDWDQGYAHVENRLDNTIAGKRLRKATPLAEKVIIDVNTGKLGIEPIPMVPDDLYNTGLEKLRDEIHYLRSDKDNNFIAALNPLLNKLDDTLQRYSDNPQRMHDTQLSAIRQIKRMVDDDALPPKDHRIAALSDTLEENALDIRAAIPEVADAVTKRSHVKFQELDDASRNKIRDVIKAVAAHSDEALAGDLAEDEEETFTSGAQPPNVESAYRLTSRLAKVEEIVRSVGPISATAGDFLAAMNMMINDISAVLEIAQILLRLLGLA